MVGKDRTGPSDGDALARQLAVRMSPDGTLNPHEMLGLLSGFAASPLTAQRPELRRPPRDDVALYRIRVDLDDAKPPVWRRLDVRSDLTLDVVHQILQAAWGWEDYHLHRFAIGGHPFDLTSQVFLCPFEIKEGNPLDGGIAASDVRLDEAMGAPGDQLRYAYDYGDSWELTLKLEKVLPAEEDSPPAVCVDGRRAAPPEDSRGDWEMGMIDGFDPAAFDVAEVNDALTSPYVDLATAEMDPALHRLLVAIEDTSLGRRLAKELPAALAEPVEQPTEEMLEALHPIEWFLDRAAGEGIPLTSAGYLKPADVIAASQVVPAMGGWIGAKNREVQCAPLLDFRESLQRVGLLRKQQGRLHLTRAGDAARRQPEALWNHLADRLPTIKPTDFDATVGMLVLAYAATSPGTEFPLAEIAATMTALGWRTQGAPGVTVVAVSWVPTLNLLRNLVSEQRDRRQRDVVTPTASAVARASLRELNRA